MLVFSNPFDETCLSNHEEWTIKLHSDVGFRNYLEKIHEMIIEWTRDEEAKYQANLVSKEVDKFASESKEKEENSASSRLSNKSKQQSPSPDKAKKKTAAAAGRVSFCNCFWCIYQFLAINITEFVEICLEI